MRPIPLIYPQARVCLDRHESVIRYSPEAEEIDLPEVERPPEGEPLLFIFGKKGPKQQLFADCRDQLAPAHVVSAQRGEQLIAIVLAVQLS